MSEKNQKGKRSYNRGRKGGQKRAKEVEIDIDRQDINKADLRGDSSSSRIKGKRDGHNDVSWYANNESLLRDSASFPYSRPVGSRITRKFNATVSTPNNSPLSIEGYDRSVPGIMTLTYSSVTGSYNGGATSPINIAANAIYTFVRHANSGSKIYDAPDLMMYLMAMDSAYAHYAYMVRMYGAIQLNSPYNRYLPKALIAQMGGDYEDLSSNLAQFRYFINQYAFKLSQLCVPADMAVFARHVWMNSNIYMDSAAVKAQYYMFVPNNYYHFVEQTDEPGYLTYKTYASMNDAASGKLNLQSLVNISNDILEPILQSEDMNVMSGDILKAFGQENIYKIQPIAENYFVQPVYNAEVLSQIENSVVAGGAVIDTTTPKATNAWNIYQVLDLDIAGGPYLQQNIVVDPSFSGLSEDEAQIVGSVASITKTINMHKDGVTPADTMVATRLTCLPHDCSVVTSGSTYRALLNYEFSGTEIINRMAITLFEDRGGIWGTTTYNYMWYATIMAKAYATQDVIMQKMIGLLSKFDWHPEINVIYANSYFDIVWDSGYSIMNLLDTDNYTLMDAEDLQNMHETALLSMFNCPRMASLSTKPYNKM